MITVDKPEATLQDGLRLSFNVERSELENGGDTGSGPGGGSNSDPDSGTTSSGKRYRIESDGTVKFLDLPRLDIRRESEDRISSHIFNVIYQTKVLFCDKGKYHPIDWRNYLIGGSFFDRSFG